MRRDERNDGRDPVPDGLLSSKGRKKRPGELIREGALYATPTILIVYPIVGFLLGYLTVKYLGWPFWVPIVTMLLGLVQAIREVYRLSRKVYGEKTEKDDI